MRNKILLVDDDREFREEFRQCLKEYEIVQASSGEEAVSVLKKPNEIGLVILDVNLPGMKGIEALRRIKETSPGLAIVILTGHSSEGVAIQALKGHADDYIEKPFEIGEMKEVIERLLSALGRPADGPDLKDAGSRIRRIKEFVERNCFKKITLADAAKAVSLCPKYVSRIFKEEAGTGFARYRIGVQMEKAKELLAKNSCNINELSDRLGYQNPESFIRQFKKFTGLTPSEYRCRKKQGNNGFDK
jgi:two-component system response regulator YesN